jgi:hypothetical protein
MPTIFETCKPRADMEAGDYAPASTLIARAIRLMQRPIRNRTSCSQNRNTTQPFLRKARVNTRSLAALAKSFLRHHLRLVLG